MNKLSQKLKERLVNPVIRFLKQGMSPLKLSLCIAIGFVLGLFPVVGVTSILCALVAVIFRLNMAVIQLINYFVYPLQLLLIIPLIKFGTWLFDINPMPYTLDQILEMVQQNTWEAFEKLWLSALLGIATWGIIIVPLGLLLFIILKIILNRVKIPGVTNVD